MQFADFDVDLFLREYWQKRPLLIRNPWAAWSNPLEPDELAGLACEEGVESRLVIQTENGLAMESGPIPAERFGELGSEPWTLLVQAVDHHVPGVAALIEPFRFVPDWRIDDVMVSYATSGGGVGPHFDQYDVFLVQGQGTRRWRIGPVCNSQTPLVPHDDLRLLPNFDASGDWILEPGDILYVPPGVAHDGVAASHDCMTYSIGFRAPSVAELVEGWAEHVADSLPEDDRYADPGLERQANPGEIQTSAVERMQAMVLAALSDRDEFARWFGIYSSLPKYADADWRPEDAIAERQIRDLMACAAPLRRNPASRFSFIRLQDRTILLFVDGECFECRDDMACFAEALCAQTCFVTPEEIAISPSVVALVTTLAERGNVAFDVED